jgi:hypothetical protein
VSSFFIGGFSFCGFRGFCGSFDGSVHWCNWVGRRLATFKGARQNTHSLYAASAGPKKRAVFGNNPSFFAIIPSTRFEATSLIEVFAK